MSRDHAEHFYKWLDKTVYKEDQHIVEEQIHALLKEHPDLLETHSWPEMRVMAQHLEV